MDFVTFARVNGVLISDLDASGRIRRCPTESHPRSKNGAYLWDGERGFVMAWDGDAKAIWFDRPDYRPDQAEIAKREAIMRRQREQQDAAHQRAAQRASDLLGSCVIDHHPYLNAKGLHKEKGLVTPDGGLFVPMRSIDGNLRGAQLIRLAGDAFEKKMMPGMKAKGAIFRIGPKTASKTIFVEGYATGLSVAQACHQMRLGAVVLVCFSAGNVEYVSQFIQGQKGAFADHDATGRGEQAAKTAGIPYVMSERVGEDANDLHQRAGIFALMKRLQELRL